MKLQQVRQQASSPLLVVELGVVDRQPRDRSVPTVKYHLAAIDDGDLGGC